MQQLAHGLERLGSETAFSVAKAAAAGKAKGNPVLPFSVLFPYGPATHHLIGTKQLAAMQSSAYLVNTARGPVVDEAAPASALREAQIAGARHGVFENEPRAHPRLHTGIK